MLISIAAAENSAKSPIPEHLEEAAYLFIVETEQNAVLKVLDCAEGESDMLCAKYTVDEKCEAIICGDIAKAAFDLLADNMISRYYGWGANASQAVRLLRDNRLQLIRASREGDHCQGEDHWQELQRTIDTVANK